MTNLQQALLEELEAIDTALLKGNATSAQERRGREIVNLANTAQQLLDALKAAEEQLSEYCLGDDGRDQSARMALRKVRAAIASATGRAP